MLAALVPALGPGGMVLMHDGLGPGARRSDCRETVRLLEPLCAVDPRAGWRSARRASGDVLAVVAAGAAGAGPRRAGAFPEGPMRLLERAGVLGRHRAAPTGRAPPPADEWALVRRVARGGRVARRASSTAT